MSMCYYNCHCVGAIELFPAIVAVLSYLYHRAGCCFCIIFITLFKLSLLSCDSHCIAMSMHFVVSIFHRVIVICLDMPLLPFHCDVVASSCLLHCC